MKVAVSRRLSLAVCCSMLMLPGCQASEAERLKAELIRQAALERVTNDNDMIVSDWYRRGYFVSSDGMVCNSVFNSMIGLHVLLWAGLSIAIGVVNQQQQMGWHRYLGIPDYEPEVLGWIILIGGTIAIFALWVVLWLLAGVFVPMFSTSRYIPFGYVGFLVLLSLYAAIAACGVARLIGLIRVQQSGPSSRSPYTPTAQQPVPIVTGSKTTLSTTRQKRVVRAVLKALFVSIASAVGGKIGGLIGGVIVFLITAGVSAWFEIPGTEGE